MCLTLITQACRTGLTSFNSSFLLNPSRIHRDPRQTSPPPQPLPRARTLASTVLLTQLRLAQIVETMHTTSLLHDDVIDASAFCRGVPSAPSRVWKQIFCPRRKFFSWSSLSSPFATRRQRSHRTHREYSVEPRTLRKSKTTSKPPTRMRSLGSLPTIAPAGNVVIPHRRFAAFASATSTFSAARSSSTVVVTTDSRFSVGITF